MSERIQDLFDFIEESPTAFHTVETMKQRFMQAGFIELEESVKWILEYGNKYFVTRNHSSILAFVLPKHEYIGYHIVASHTDSPALKIKANPEIAVEKAYVKLNVEKYGGMILSTWLDRPVSIAGRVFVKEAVSEMNRDKKRNELSEEIFTEKGEEGEYSFRMKEYLVNLKEHTFVIPNVAIHMNGELNKGYSYNPQVDMLPIYSAEKQDTLNQMLANHLGITKEDILSEELYLYTKQPGCCLGANEEWILAPRLDDLQCTYASMVGLLQAEPEDYVAMGAYFDNEEVGSGTKQGADSDFLENILWRIRMALGESEEKQLVALHHSFLISADNAHAVHPNHVEKADPVNQPKLNEGIVMKYHGGQKYTTDGYSAAYFKALAAEAGVSVQEYTNRSDVLGGSTLGNISTAHVSIPAVDVGFPQLAMHSAVETAGEKDVWDGIILFQHFFSK